MSKSASSKSKAPVVGKAAGKSTPSKVAPAKTTSGKVTLVAKPVARKGTAKPVAGKGTAKPVAGKGTAKPVAGKGTAKPVAKSATKANAKAAPKPIIKATLKTAAKSGDQSASSLGRATIQPMAKNALKPAGKVQPQPQAKTIAKPPNKPVQPAKAQAAKAPLAPQPVAAKPAMLKPVAAPAPVAAKPVQPVAPRPQIAAPQARPPLATPAGSLRPAAPSASAIAAAEAAKEDARKKLNFRNAFKTNEYVVYPSHGVGKIIAVEEQSIAGMKVELFVITFEHAKMTMRVPTAKLAENGMRKLAEEPVVRRAMETLKGRARVKRTMWSRRAQEYDAKIKSGDLVSIAEVVRDLYRAESQPEQSYSERQLFEAALDRMSREIAAIEKLDERGAVQKVVDVLAKSAKSRKAAEAGPAVVDPETDAADDSEAAQEHAA